MQVRRNCILVRQFRLLALLRHAGAHGLTLKAMSGPLGVSDRTIRRDLEGLQEVHVPITLDGDRWQLSSRTCPLCCRNASATV